MSVRMRHTRAHTNNRRSHHALSAGNVVKDKETGKLRLPHRVDESTGMYRGKQIFTPKSKTPAIKSPKGTHHEHAHEEQKDEKKPVEAKEAETHAKEAARPRSRSGTGS